MANERFGMRCPVCKDCLYLAKTMGGGLYINGVERDYAEALVGLFKWMDEHISYCHEQESGFMTENWHIKVFDVVVEGHPDVQAMFKRGEHWNSGFVVDRDSK